MVSKERSKQGEGKAYVLYIPETKVMGQTSSLDEFGEAQGSWMTKGAVEDDVEGSSSWAGRYGTPYPVSAISPILVNFSYAGIFDSDLVDLRCAQRLAL